MLLHNERVDFQYFINLQTIFRAKRGAKIQKKIYNNKLKPLHFEVVKYYFLFKI